MRKSFVAQIHVTVTVMSPEEIHQWAEVLTQFAAAQHPKTAAAEPPPQSDPDLPPPQILNALFVAKVAPINVDDVLDD